MGAPTNLQELCVALIGQAVKSTWNRSCNN